MQRRKGLTLVELLMVVVMIMLLVVMVVPSLVGTKRLTQSIGCRKNLKDQGTALTMFTGEHNGAVPTHGSFYLPEGIGRYLHQPYQNLFSGDDYPGFSDRETNHKSIKHAVRAYEAGFVDEDGVELRKDTWLKAKCITGTNPGETPPKAGVREGPSQYICPAVKKPSGDKNEELGSLGAYLHYGVSRAATGGQKRGDNSPKYDGPPAHTAFADVPFVDMRQFNDLRPYLNTDTGTDRWPTDPYDSAYDGTAIGSAGKVKLTQVFSLKLAGATLDNVAPSEFCMASDSRDSLNGSGTSGLHGLRRHGGPTEASKRTSALMLDGSVQSVKTDGGWGVLK